MILEEVNMKNIIIFIKGFIFGTANIIPGVSGGTIAITLNIYEKILNIFGYFTKNIKENLKFLIPFGLGILGAVILMSNVISYSLSNYAFATTMLFVGLILGGLPPILNRLKENYKQENIIYLIISFIIVILITLLGNDGSKVVLDIETTTFITLLLVGAVASTAMVVPGISGSFVLMMLGYYEPLINVIKNVFDFNDIIFNFTILGFFGVGVLVGIIYASRIIEYCLKNYNNKTYFSITGFVLASMISIFTNINQSVVLTDILIGIPLLIIGIIISRKLGE
jgi:putative membrane protein